MQITEIKADFLRLLYARLINKHFLIKYCRIFNIYNLYIKIITSSLLTLIQPF